MNPPDTIPSESRHAAGKIQEALFIAAESFGYEAIFAIVTQACLAYHKRRLEECGDAKEASKELCRQLGGLREWTATELQMITNIISPACLSCAAKEVEKGTAKIRQECAALRRGCESADTMIDAMKADFAFREATLQKQCEELRLSLSRIQSSLSVRAAHTTATELAMEVAKSAALRLENARLDKSVQFWRDQLSTLQEDVRPLLRFVTPSKHVNTFLSKHPELANHPPDDDDDATCQRCNGEGRILICVDDMCRGAGECMHGDGYAMCPNCKGEGEV